MAKPPFFPRLSCRPFVFTFQGAGLDLLRPVLWCGMAGAFRFFLRALGAKWGWMLGWVPIKKISL